MHKGIKCGFGFVPMNDVSICFSCLHAPALNCLMKPRQYQTRYPDPNFPLHITMTLQRPSILIDFTVII